MSLAKGRETKILKLASRGARRDRGEQLKAITSWTPMQSEGSDENLILAADDADKRG